MQIKQFKHILWDWNGTLFNDADLCIDLINGVLQKRDKKALTAEEYKNIFTFPVKDYYSKAGLDFSKHSFELLGKEWMDQYELRKNECSLFPNAKEVITFISTLGIEQSILSAYSQHTLLAIVESHGILNNFTYVTGLDHIYATGKVEIGKELIAKINLSGNEIVLIGDTIHDYEVAMELGIKSILIARGHQSKDRLLECNVPVLDDISEIVH